VTASHGALDALTNGGLGVAFFAPFSNARYFFPWRPVEVSPIGVAPFFSEWGVRVLESELVWLWLPAAALMLCAWACRRLTAR
jgi:inner membrane protein